MSTPIRLHDVLKVAEQDLATASLEARICNLKLVDQGASWDALSKIRKHLEEIEAVLDDATIADLEVA